MRQIGATGGGRIPLEEFEEYLEQNFLESGYTVFHQHVDPIYEDNEFKGYRVFVTLVAKGK